MRRTDRSERSRFLPPVAYAPDDFRGAIEAMLDPFVLHRTLRRDDGTAVGFELTYANGAATRLAADATAGSAGSTLLDLRSRGAGAHLFRRCLAVVDTGDPLLVDAFEPDGPREPGAIGRILDLRIVRSGDGVAITARDITRYIDAERAAHKTEHRLLAAIEQTAESVVIADRDATILYVNPAFELTTGYAAADAIGRNPRILQSGMQPPAFYEDMWHTLLSGRTWRGELVNRRKDGTHFIEDASITPVHDAAGNLSSYVAVKRDVTDLRAVESALAATIRERAAVLESLARLDTQATPERTAEAICDALVRLPRVDAAMVIQFTNGRASVLGWSGPRVPGLHPGGVLPDTRAEYLLRRAARGPWAEPWRPRREDGDYGSLVGRTGVTGIACAPLTDGAGTITALVAAATNDPAGADRMTDMLPLVREFAGAARTMLNDIINDRARIDLVRSAVAEVIATTAFQPVFQPVVDLRTGEQVGFEALTRFSSGRRPDQVFAEAHAAGIGVELEAATMHAALTASERLPAEAWLSLNVSPRLALDGDRLRDALASRRRPIVIEVTEHEVIEDYGALRAAFARLGGDLRFAVDDAGAGVANFSHIVELRPDFVKIDVGLVRDLNADLTRQAVVVGMLHFARATERWVIAEGVETEAERATLERLEVPYAQGYLFGAPASVEELLANRSDMAATVTSIRRTRRRTGNVA